MRIKTLLVVCLFCLSFGENKTKPTDTGFLGSGLVSKLCWECMQPFRIGGVIVGGTPFKEEDLKKMQDKVAKKAKEAAEKGEKIAKKGSLINLKPYDKNTLEGSLPVCYCPPFKFGLTVSFYEAARFIEIIKRPYQSPILGINKKSKDIEVKDIKKFGSTSRESVNFSQAHYGIMPIMKMLGLFTDFLCTDQQESDFGYMTEFDPLWSDDLLSAVLNPESVLFANPVSQAACAADALSTTFTNKPLDYLFWCKGSWGSAYPLNGFNGLRSSNLMNAFSLSATMLYKMQRMGILKQSWGANSMCAAKTNPVWKKSVLRMQLVTPSVMQNTVQIGTGGVAFEQNKDFVFHEGNYGFIIFKKKDCCAAIGF